MFKKIKTARIPIIPIRDMSGVMRCVTGVISSEKVAEYQDKVEHDTADQETSVSQIMAESTEKEK